MFFEYEYNFFQKKCQCLNISDYLRVVFRGSQNLRVECLVDMEISAFFSFFMQNSFV